MLRVLGSIRAFLRRDDGPTAVEYAVHIAFIAAIAMSAIRSVGSNAAATFSRVASSVNSASSGSGSGNSGNSNGGGNGNGNNGNGNGNGGGNGSNGGGNGNGNSGQGGGS